MNKDWIDVIESLPDFNKNVLVAYIPKQPDMSNKLHVGISRRIDKIEILN